MTFEAKQVTAFLRDLGSTPEEIRTKVPKGRRKCGSGCPVANALQQRFADVDYWLVGCYADAVKDARTVVSVLPPEPVTEFIRNFDAGMYPELVEETL